MRSEIENDESRKGAKYTRSSTAFAVYFII